MASERYGIRALTSFLASARMQGLPRPIKSGLVGCGRSAERDDGCPREVSWLSPEPYSVEVESAAKYCSAPRTALLQQAPRGAPPSAERERLVVPHSVLAWRAALAGGYYYNSQRLGLAPAPRHVRACVSRAIQ
jgi:hypothetical protein